MSEDTDSYTDQIGWTTSGSETVLSDLKDMEEIEKEGARDNHPPLLHVRYKDANPKTYSREIQGRVRLS